MRSALTALFCSFAFVVSAGTVSGVVKDTRGNPLAFCSILVKGTTVGTTGNSQGFFNFTLAEGTYTLICQHVGYKPEEKKIRVGGPVQIDFVLQDQTYSLGSVTIRSGGEDPAYAIIRKAIAKRKEYQEEHRRFTSKVYIKGQIQLRNYPDRFMGKKVDFDDDDTSKRKMLFLSEVMADYSVDGSRQKIEVTSSRVSGQSNGFGFSNPQIISFYDNTIPFNAINPRGFVSPIASGALGFYKYKLEGSFYENGVEVNRIKVIPRRKYEPLFAGYINIIEGQWRIHSVQLYLLREQQMQLLDTLRLEQLYVPANGTWVIKQQLLEPAGKFFSFDFFGSFLQVYSDFVFEPSFGKKFFDRTFLKFTDTANKKPALWWDSIRPVPLLQIEQRDYERKDSIEKLHNSKAWLDSADRSRNKVSPLKALISPVNIAHRSSRESYYFDPLLALAGTQYNAVEGHAAEYHMRYRKGFGDRRSLSLEPALRYGFDNRHFNADLTARYAFGVAESGSISLSGGKKVFQFNNADPISPFNNTLAALIWKHNHMKLYEAPFAAVTYTQNLGDIRLTVSGEFQDRKPLVNAIDSLKGKPFEPNYPIELHEGPMPPNKSLSATVSLRWRPGSQYVEIPGRRFGIGSRYPIFGISVTQGIKTLLGSDADFAKWRFTVTDDLNFKIGGRFNYRLAAGGFLYANSVFAPDYRHFLGNETVIASEYLNSFQLAHYYQYSNTAKFYAEGHVEYHLNGLLTNKVPGFRRLNWFLVTGANALFIDHDRRYVEVFAGLENIFKLLRVDVVRSWQQGGSPMTGIRLGLPAFGGRRF